MAIAHKLGLRLFLEGIEVPVISAQIQIIADSPAAASIQIIATDRAIDFLPRTMVHLFFYDFVAAESYTPTADQSAEAFDHQQYKLLFMGEVQGVSFSKDSSNRSIMLSCVDFSNYWDTTYQYNFGGQLLGGRREAAFIGANANLLTSPLGNGVGTIERLLQGNSANFPELRGLLAGIVHVLEAVGGTYQGKWTFKGANDFSSIAELRIKLLRQIWAAEKDTSTKNLFQRKTFNMWMNRECGGLSKLVTFRGLVQLMQRFIYHEVYPNPAAYYQPKTPNLTRTKTTATDLFKDTRTSKFMQSMKDIEASRYSAQSLLNQGTVGVYMTEIELALSHMASVLREVMPNVPVVPGLNLQKTVNDMDVALKDIKNQIGTPASAGMSVDPAKLGDPNKVEAAKSDLTKIYDAYQALIGAQIKHQSQVAYEKPDRIHNQLYRPDIWFAAAPRCNVLFPEMYSSFTWSRNYLREVTRLELQLTHEVLGDDALFNQRNYSPNVKDMRSGVKLSSRRFNHLIMAHELMTGIIPMYEKMSQANLFAMRGKAVQQDKAEQKQQGGGIKKVDYAQRAVDHQYFKHRFSSRQMSAAGRFNPWFVPGFPAVVIDKPMNADALAISAMPIDQMVAALEQQPNYQSVRPDPKRGNKPSRALLLRNLVGYQYTGACVQLSHSVSQEGGSTSYGFAQARVHREDTEFLGVDKVTRSRKTGKTNSHKNTYAYPGNTVPKVGSKGPRGGKITVVKNVTPPSRTIQYNVLNDQSDADPSGVSPTHPRYVIPRYDGDGWVEVGVEIVTADSASTVYSAWQVTETIPVRETYEDRIPMEEAIRPPWIWTGWWNINIGDTYNEMIGTNAITDIQGIVSEGFGGLFVGPDEQTALNETKEGYRAGSGAYIQKSDKGDLSYKSGQPPVQDQPTANEAAKRIISDPFGLKMEPAMKIGAADTFMIDAERTIEASIDYLTRVYSMIKVGGFDVGDFIRQYTWRPIMDIEQLLGSLDLVLQDENGVDVGQLDHARGVEGFHSRAFGNVEDLAGLVNSQVSHILGLNSKNKKEHATLMRMDTRQRKWEAVMAYSDELLSKGLLG
jgi:hypothetical protein